MELIRISSPFAKHEIIEKSKKLGLVAVNPELVHSREQFELAHILAKRSFRNKTNLANAFELEFLLWLSGERDLRSAFRKNEFSNSDFLLVSFGKTGKNKMMKEFGAKEKPLSLEKKASNLELEKISLGRIL